MSNLNSTGNRKWKIKFKAGDDTFEKYVKGKNIIEGLTKFYNNAHDYKVMSIEEVEEWMKKIILMVLILIGIMIPVTNVVASKNEYYRFKIIQKWTRRKN